MISFADHLQIVLVSPRNPLNIGAAARAISNFGFTHLDVVNAYEVAYQEAKSAVNAASILQASRQFSSVADAVAECHLVVGTTSVGTRDLEQPLRTLAAAGPLLQTGLARGRVALLFGSEKFGLSNDDLSYCHWLLRIPTRDAHASMNLGQSVAVCLYELIRQGGMEEGTYEPVTHQQLELLTNRLAEVLRYSGYLEAEAASGRVRKLRQLVQRLQMPQKDVHIWLGILRQILWRLRTLQERTSSGGQ